MADKSSKRVNLILRVKGCSISLPDGTETFISWVRGPKKVDCRNKPSQSGKTTFNEKFEIKTQVEYDFSTGAYLSKPVLY